MRRELEGGDRLNAKSTTPQVDAAVERILASLDASHTARFKQDSIAYYELADIFRFAIRKDMKRLFPPDGRASYPGIGMNGCRCRPAGRNVPEPRTLSAADLTFPSAENGKAAPAERPRRA